MGRLNGMGGTTCPAGYYQLKFLGIPTGQCVPSLDTLKDIGTGALTTGLATGAAGSTSNQAAALAAGQQTAAKKFFDFVGRNKTLVIGGAAVASLLLVYGGMSFLRGGNRG